MSKKIFVGNCDFKLEDSSLQDFIESNGIKVVSTKIITDRETGRSRGFAFVEVDEGEDLTHVINTLNGKEIEGRALTVNEAREQDRSGGGGYGGGRNNGGGGRW